MTNESVLDAVLDEVWDPSWNRPAQASSARPLPWDVEEITPEWLTKALSIKAPGLKVNDCKVTRVRHGFTSVIQVTMDLNEIGRKAGVPPRIVIKGGFTQYSRTYAFGYAMEAHGYRDILPLGLNMPKIYFVDLEPERHQSVIIMEDLNDRGVTFGEGLKPIGYDMMSRRLTALAAFHAKTWDSPELRSGGRYHGVLQNGVRLNRMHMEVHGYIDLGDDERSRQRSEYRQMPPFLTPEGWETMWAERMSQNAAASHHFRDFEWNRKAMAHLEELSDQLPNCVLHGDTHLGNHFQEPDGTPGFFDPMPRREPAYFELAYTITTGLDPYDRRKWERALVGHYLAELGRNGVKLDFNLTMYYYALFLHAGYIWFIINDPVWQTSAFNTVHVFRFCSAMMDNGTKELMDAVFREKALRSQSTTA
jgi:hypothetical protein